MYYILHVQWQTPKYIVCLQMLPRQSAVLRPCNNGLEENRGEACKPKPEEDKGLKKAIADLSTWTWTLRGMEEVMPKGPHERKLWKASL